MMTQEFQQGIDNLLEIADRQRTALMCAEAVFWRCHRRLVSDSLVAKGVAVRHIMPTGELRPHRLTLGAVMESGTVTYPSLTSLFS
jgi:uncharacterized protein (DUF488 family)